MKLQNYFWTFPFLSFLIGYAVTHFATNVQYVETPSLVGKNIVEAFPILSAQNLNPRLLGKKEDPELPEGTILSQTPQAQQKIKPHQSIFLVVSKKAAPKQAPNCINKTEKEIKHAIHAQGIRLETQYVANNYPNNRCFAQQPAPNQPLKDNNLTVYISADNQKAIIWPDFMGKNITQVKHFLSEHNIKPTIMHIKKIKPEHVCTHCKVLEQRPLAGSLIKLDNPKNLMVQLRVK